MPTLRSYCVADEPALRRICFDTALYGVSIAPVWDDPELITEALMGYYLRFEPDDILVAEFEGRVVGYLAGCLDHARFERESRRHIAPTLLRLFLRRGRWHDPHLWRQFPRLAAHGWQRRALLRAALPAYPAHLHINLDSSVRGAGLGGRLLDAFLPRVAQTDSGGLHVVTTFTAGRLFFERHGFRALATRATPSLRDGSPVALHLLVWRPAAPTLVAPSGYASSPD